MSAPKVLVAFPGPAVKSIIWDRPDVVVFDASGWWLFDAATATRRHVDVFEFTPTWSSNLDFGDLIERIRALGPIWARWVAHAEQYELHSREAANYVLHVIEGLSSLGVGAAVFHTGVAHHLDSSLLQIACAKRRVPQVFLYENPIVTRLQPLVQMSSIADRRPLNAVVSDYQAGDAIRRFHANSLAGRKPATSLRDAPITRMFRSPWFGVADAFYISARARASAAVRRFTDESTPSTRFYQTFKPLGLPEFLRLIGNQRRGLKYHDAHVERGDPFQRTKRDGRFTVLLASHYQPEATSFPEGGQLHNHIDIVVKLRAIGYEGPLVYKEHIGSYLYYSHIIHQTRVGMNRNEAYYRMLRELGCVFMDPGTTFTINDAANAWVLPLTLTGSMALARALAGLRTIVCGVPWYKGLPGTWNLSSIESLDELSYESARPSTEPSPEAFAFLEGQLSRSTMVNAPGVGSGRPSNDPDTIKAFTGEFNRFLEHLQVLAG